MKKQIGFFNMYINILKKIDTEIKDVVKVLEKYQKVAR